MRDFFNVFRIEHIEFGVNAITAGILILVAAGLIYQGWTKTGLLIVGALAIAWYLPLGILICIVALLWRWIAKLGRKRIFFWLLSGALGIVGGLALALLFFVRVH